MAYARSAYQNSAYQVITITPSYGGGISGGGGKEHRKDYFPNIRKKEEEEEILLLIKIIHEYRYRMVLGE